MTLRQRSVPTTCDCCEGSPHPVSAPWKWHIDQETGATICEDCFEALTGVGDREAYKAHSSARYDEGRD